MSFARLLRENNLLGLYAMIEKRTTFYLAWRAQWGRGEEEEERGEKEEEEEEAEAEAEAEACPLPLCLCLCLNRL